MSYSGLYGWALFTVWFFLTLIGIFLFCLPLCWIIFLVLPLEVRGFFFYISERSFTSLIDCVYLFVSITKDGLWFDKLTINYDLKVEGARNMISSINLKESIIRSLNECCHAMWYCVLCTRYHVTFCFWMELFSIVRIIFDWTLRLSLSPGARCPIMLEGHLVLIFCPCKRRIDCI